MASYYRPYASGSDSGTESESDSDTSYSSEPQDLSGSLPNFRALAAGLFDTAGPSFDLSSQILYMKKQFGSPLNQPNPSFTDLEIKPDASGVQLKSSSQSVNSIIMLLSNDRDRSVYPQPTVVTLRLPRVYKNVTSFQIVQIKLLSSFFYFRPDKFNTDITIIENGRSKVRSLIRTGTYDINSLMTEIQTQLNATPIFYDFPNGFQDFALRFASTGDFGVNFNYPGDSYYDSLEQRFVPNPTMTSIVSHYFQNQFAGLSSYTTDQLKVAYYYPVLKEELLNTPDLLDLNITAILQPGETVYSRCIYTFQGINDPVILAVINLNLDALDTYRLQNTFRYSLVNEYSVALQTQSNRITISSSSLNKSLVTLLQTKQTQFLAQSLTAAGLTPATYAALQTQNTLLLAVLNDMFYYLQRYLANYFGIPFNTYDISYLASPDFVVPIRDATGAVGISSNYDAAVLARNTKPITTNILAQFQQNPPYYWPGYSNVPNQTVPINLETGNVITSSNYAYDIFKSEQDRSRRFIDLSSELIYTNALSRYSDIVVPLNAAEYTVFKFKSPVRQTLQIETLPRPTEYRYLGYNALYADASNQQIFDNSYSFVNTQPAALDWVLDGNYVIEPIPGFATAPFGLSYAQSLALWGSQTITSYIGSTVHLFAFTTLAPITTQPARYPLSVTVAADQTFVTPLNVFLYHDRAAFLADVSSNGSESAFNYLATTNTADVSSATITVNVYPSQIYYVLVRAAPTSATQKYRVIPWQPDGTAFETISTSLANFDPLADPTTPQALSNFNYAQVTDPAWIRLPISSNLVPPTRVDPLYTPLTFSTPTIGYDVNGVSTDATDYFGYQPGAFGVINSATRIDPVNGYIFQKSSDYNPSTQTYFYNNSLNTILTPQGASVYTISTVTSRETSIVHTYYNTYLPNSENQAPMLSAYTAPAAPFTSSITSRPIGGYVYGGSNGSIQFGDGVAGLSFVPQQGAWTIQRAMVASAYTTDDPATDTNRGIQYLGVFNAGQLPAFSADLQLTSSIAVLKQSKVTTYGPLNFGFGAGGGTFYEFTSDPSFASNPIYGYSQIRGEIDTDPKAIYTLVPFDLTGKILPYQGLLGSLVPYPDVNNVPVDVSAAYFDGTSTSKELLIPISPDPSGPGGPPPGYDITQSQYERSMPIGTTLLHYLTPYPFLTDPDAMSAWPLPTTYLNPVFDVSGYVLTADSVFHIYSYSSTARVFEDAYQITLDQLSPAGTDFLGVAANESQYAFAFYDPSGTLIFHLMEPATGRVAGTYSYPSPAFDKILLKALTYNNAGGFTITTMDDGLSTVYSLPTATSSTFTTLSVSGPIIVRQAPKNNAGQFYVFPLENDVITHYYYIDPTLPSISGDLVAYVGATGVSTTRIDLPGAYTNPIVAREPFKEDLFFLKLGSINLYQITGFQGTTAIITPTVYTFPAVPTKLYQGPMGSKWAFADTLYANRNNSTDAPKMFTPAWQIFYPTQRLVFKQIANNFSFMRNRTGIEYPEYPHTAISVYDSLTKLRADIGTGNGKWGLESSSNFLVADYRFSGELFNASIFSVPLQPNTTYYTTLRNYTPTEKSQAILRCSLPNKYDFGYVKLVDLSGEIAITASSSNLFAPNYYASLTGFNSNFVLSSITFGANIIQGFNGSNFSNITGFGDFYSRFTSLYATYNNQVQQVQAINTSVTSSINTFIQTDLQNILPPTAQNRQRYTDPLTFSILWQSSLTNNYMKKEDNWGLGWNLGYDKVDTPFATVQISQSFFKILDDYINLRLNPEYDMNRVDSGAKENLSLTNEPTGSTKAFHAKLLLANFGSYAQTLISNPVAFSPPLGRMDKITFQWLDATETKIDNSDCEWNVVVQIVEKVEVVEMQKAPLVYAGTAAKLSP